MQQKTLVHVMLLVLAVGGCSGKPPVDLDQCLSDLNSQDAVTRREAVKALGQLGEEGAVAVPALVRMLNDPNDDIRVSVAESLGRIGPDAAIALPALEKARKDKYGPVQEAAAEAIKRIKGS